VDDEWDVDEIDPGTSSLQIVGPSRFARLASRKDVVFPFSQTLEELRVDFPSECDAKFFHPSRIIDLIGKYPALDDFTFNILNSSDLSSPSPSSHIPLPATPSFVKIQHLSLGANLSDSSLLPSLASSFPALTSLTLTDLSLDDLDRVLDFIDQLPNPQNIETLILDLGDQSHEESTTLPRILAKFTSLKVLGLPEIPLDDLYPVLPNLPLQRLRFGINDSLTALEVTRFLSGPTKIQSLEVVELDNLEDLPAVEGERIPSFIGPDAVDYTLMQGLGWRPATWTDGFELDDFERLAEVAEREGVRLEGGTVDAKRVDDAELSELRRHRAYWRKTKRVQGSSRNRIPAYVFLFLALAQGSSLNSLAEFLVLTADERDIKDETRFFVVDSETRIHSVTAPSTRDMKRFYRAAPAPAVPEGIQAIITTR